MGEAATANDVEPRNQSLKLKHREVRITYSAALGVLPINTSQVSGIKAFGVLGIEEVFQSWAV